MASRIKVSDTQGPPGAGLGGDSEEEQETHEEKLVIDAAGLELSDNHLPLLPEC